jgi:hypothetical protein
MTRGFLNCLKLCGPNNHDLLDPIIPVACLTAAQFKTDAVPTGNVVVYPAGRNIPNGPTHPQWDAPSMDCPISKLSNLKSAQRIQPNRCSVVVMNPNERAQVAWGVLGTNLDRA